MAREQRSRFLTTATARAWPPRPATDRSGSGIWLGAASPFDHRFAGRACKPRIQSRMSPARDRRRRPSGGAPAPQGEGPARRRRTECGQVVGSRDRPSHPFARGTSRLDLRTGVRPRRTALRIGRGDRKIRIWEISSGRTVLSLEGHTGEILGIAFSPDGSRLASCGVDRKIRVWDLASGKTVHELDGHTNWVMGIAFSPDGTRLASSGADQSVRLWDPVRGGLCSRCVATAAGSTGWLSAPMSASRHRLGGWHGAALGSSGRVESSLMRAGRFIPTMFRRGAIVRPLWSWRSMRSRETHGASGQKFGP